MTNTNRIAVTGVRSVEIDMTDPARAAEFYVNVWRLKEVARIAGSIYLRGSGRYHHVLAIHPSHGPASIRRVVFDAASRDIVDAIHRKAADFGAATEEPRELDGPQRGYGFGLKDFAGRNWAIITDADDHADGGKSADTPVKVAHVNINTPAINQTHAFLTDVLGFRFVDHAGSLRFYNADNPDHNSIVVCETSYETLNHVAYEMPDLESIMRGAGRMNDSGYPIEWGVGRHGAANNSFAYFAGPEEFPLEYTSDILQIDDSYQFNGPEHWKWPAGRLDQWGVTPPHTTRWKRVQKLYAFKPDAYLLSAG